MDEFTIYFIGNILISAIVTAFTYGFGPITITLFWGKPIQKKKFKGFCIIYTIVVWFSWQMYRESSGNGVSIMPAILWGYVSYLIANGIMDKKYGGQNKLKKEKQDLNAEASKPEQQAALPEPVEVESEQPEEQPKKEPEIQRWYTCPKCGQLVKDGEECDCEAVKLALEEERKKQEEQKKQKRQALKKALPLYVVCAVLLVVVCALGFYSYNLKGQVDKLSAKNIELNGQIIELDNQVDDLSQKNRELTELNNKLSQKESSTGNSLTKIVYYIADSKNKKYHVPSCSLVKNINKEDIIYLNNYITLLIEKENGYTQCTNCNPDKTTPKEYFIPIEDYTSWP